MSRRITFFAVVLSGSVSGAWTLGCFAESPKAPQQNQLTVDEDAATLWLPSSRSAVGEQDRQTISPDEIDQVETDHPLTWSAAGTWTPTKTNTAAGLDPVIAQDVDRLLDQERNWLQSSQFEVPEPQAGVVIQTAGSSRLEATFHDDLDELISEESLWIEQAQKNQQRKIDSSLSLRQTSEVGTRAANAGYLNDLEDLAGMVDQTPQTRYTSTSRSNRIESAMGVDFAPVDRQHALVQVNPNDNYTPDPVENLKSVEQLFAPISQLKVTGKSTGNVTKEKLTSPEDRSSHHIDQLIPGKYLAPSVFHVRHPNRYPHCFTHNPLYFEDPNFERCGMTCGYLSTGRSAALFAGQVAAIPYLLFATPPRTCLTTLGDCQTCEEFEADAYFREWRKH